MLAFNNIWAQAPNMINYQGVAFNSGGTAIANQTISIRATVHQTTASGTILYSEERSVSTDDGGLFNFQIGSTGATASVGSWAAINWENNAKFLQIEMDALGGTNFINMGTQQLVSVPYAQHANKASALIPTATINPNQINAGGASNNQVLKYNGTNWVPAADVSAFALPYLATDAGTESFRITNSNSTNGTAIYGVASGNGAISRGVFGYSYGTNGVGVKGLSVGTNGIGLEGEASQLGGVAIQGNHTGNGIAIEGITGTGKAVRGECTGTTGTAIYGTSNGATGIAIHGETSNGTGVKGYGNNASSIGVSGISLAGTGVYATSFTGLALDVNGNLKIAGGNTSPGAGKVLTSDANGNATWKSTKVGFSTTGSNTVLTASTTTKVKFDAEQHDASANFNLESAATDKSTFIAPIAGVYHFDAYAGLHIASSSSNITTGHILIYVNGFAVRSKQYDDDATDLAFHSYIYATLNEDIHLNAGDKVDLRVIQSNTTNVTGDTSQERFSGHLVFAD